MEVFSASPRPRLSAPNDAGLEGKNAGVFQHGITSDGKGWTDLNSDGLVTGHVVEFDVVSSLSAFVVLLSWECRGGRNVWPAT